MAKRQIELIELEQALPEVLHEVTSCGEEIIVMQDGTALAAIVPANGREWRMNEQRSIEFGRDVLCNLHRTPWNARKLLLSRIRALKDDPYPSGCRPLRRPPGAHRLKAGEYRIVYTVFDHTVYIDRIGTREEVYADL